MATRLGRAEALQLRSTSSPIDAEGVVRYVTHNTVLQARDHKEALAALG